MSKYYDILNGVKEGVAGATEVPVVLRDNLFLVQGETVPLILVSAGNLSEKIRFQTFGNNVVYDYMVLVAYVTPGNRNLNTGLDDYLHTRQTIRNQLFQVAVPGLMEAWDTNMKTGSVSKFAALIGSNYKVTGFEMRYSVAEIRQGA